MCPNENHSKDSYLGAINTFGRTNVSKKLRKFRQQQKLLGTTRLNQTMGKIVSVMLETPELEKVAIKILNCNSHKRCNQYQCSHCGVPFKEQNVNISSNDQILPYEFPAIESDTKIHSTGNSRVDWGNRFYQFEQRHKDKNIFAATINIDLFPFHQNTCWRGFGNDLVKSSRKFRRRLKTIFKKHNAEISYLGLFEDSITQISDDLKHHVQCTRWRQHSGNAEYAIKLHVHMLVAGISQEEFERILSKSGMGASKQIRCSPITETKINGHIVKGGSRGWGQYSGKMFLNYTKCKYLSWVIKFTELYRTVYKRANRKCSHQSGVNSHTNRSISFAVISSSDLSHIEYEELIDAPFQYEFEPMYGIGSYTSTSISWNTVFKRSTNSILVTHVKWVSWLTYYISNLIDKLISLSSIYNNNCPHQLSNKTQVLVNNNITFAEQFRIPRTSFRRVLIYPKRE